MSISQASQATTCWISLSLTHDPELEALRMEIWDDGRGLPADHHVGVGLIAMRERAEEVGGVFTISSGEPGGENEALGAPRGVHITVRLPIQKEEAVWEHSPS